MSGPVVRVDADESAAYFATRPRGSQVGAWASEQSRILSSREDFERAVRARSDEFEGRDVPCPPFWGGYRLEPEEIEFWQGRADRLHDRLLYRRAAGAAGWTLERLAP